MNNIKQVILLFILVPAFSFSQDSQPYSKGKIRHRISLGPVISIYKNDKNHTLNTKAKAGFNAAYKAEILLGRRTNLLVGLEYMTQGLKFNGYYLDTGYTYLYDQTFSYTHEIRYNEVQIPIGLKLAFNREKENGATPYLLGGIGFKYIFGSYTVISSDSLGTTPYDAKGKNVGYEHGLISKQFNAFYHLGLGLQKNFRNSGRAVFIEMTYKYSLSRLHYTGFENSNNLKIKESNLAITVGFRL